MPKYYPSCRVRLQLRLDEGSNNGDLKAALNRGLSGASAGRSTSSGQEDLQQQARSNRAAQDSLLGNKGGLSPLQLGAELGQLKEEERGIRHALGMPKTTLKQDDLSVVVDMLPISCEIERNNLSDASTFNLKFDFRDIPVDPRSVRSVGVSIALGSVNESQYAEGINGARRADGSYTSLIDHNTPEEITGTTKMIGFVDEWVVEFSDEGDEVTLTGRDFVGLLMDQEIPLREKAAIDLDKPLRNGVDELIQRFPANAGIEVLYSDPIDASDTAALNFARLDPGLIPSRHSPLTDDASGKTARKKKASSAKADTKVSVWEHIVDVCLKDGRIPIMRGTRLFLAQSRSVLATADNRRRMVWGGNLENLSISRKLAGVTTPTIEVRGYDPQQGRQLWARHPVLDGEPTSGILGDPSSPQPIQTRPQKVGPNGEAEETVHTELVGGVTDLAVLEEIAEEIYSRMARQELTSSWTTSDLDSFESATEADLLDLEPGEPVTIEATRFVDDSVPHVNSFLQLATMSVAKKTDYFVSRGFNRQAAQTLARATESGELQRTFRAARVMFNFNIDEGISITADCINYIVARVENEGTP